MNDIATLIATLSAIIFISPYASKILKIPTTPIEIILGALTAYLGILHEHDFFEVIAEVGFYYLMFLAGTEVDLRRLLSLKKELLLRGFGYIALLYLFSAVICFYFGFSNIYIVIMPLISIGLVLALYKEFGKGHGWLKLSMTIGTLGEFVSILALTFVSALLEYEVGENMYRSFLYLAMFLLGMYVIYISLRILFWWYPELKIYLMPLKQDKEEKDIRLSMALFFLMIALMLYLHLEIAFGAFLAGILIATFFDHKAELPHKLASFGFGFLVPIFFVYIGTTFDPKYIFEEGMILKVAVLMFLMIGIRFLSSLVFIKILSLKEMLLFALSHSMPLTLLIAVATLAYHSHSIDKFHYYLFILVSLAEVLFCMVLIKFLMRKKSKAEKNGLNS